jgi:hypothetical protein
MEYDLPNTQTGESQRGKSVSWERHVSKTKSIFTASFFFTRSKYLMLLLLMTGTVLLLLLLVLEFESRAAAVVVVLAGFGCHGLCI